MDFGAIICKPAAPLCTACVFRKECYAFLHNKINELPVKEKKILKKDRWFYYLVLEYGDEIFIRQRSSKDIWHHLHEFVLFEQKKKMGKKFPLSLLKKHNIAGTEFGLSNMFIQQLSHQQINAFFIIKKLNQKPVNAENGFWVKKNKLKQFAFPVIIREFLRSIRL